MPTPLKGYIRDGRKLPGVTTILKQKDSSGLIAGANSMGRKGKYVYGKEGEWSHSADIGTATHARIEGEIRGIDPDFSRVEFPDSIEKSMLPFQSFLVWKKDKNLEGGECEVGLIHPTYGFGGTIDFVHRGRGLILDWKTNTSLDYTDELYGQIGAYTILAEAHGIGITESTVVRFPKEGGEAEELKIDPSSEKGVAGQLLFKALLIAYEQREIIQAEEPGKLMAKVGGRRR